MATYLELTIDFLILWAETCKELQLESLKASGCLAVLNDTASADTLYIWVLGQPTVC